MFIATFAKFISLVRPALVLGFFPLSTARERKTRRVICILPYERALFIAMLTDTEFS